MVLDWVHSFPPSWTAWFLFSFVAMPLLHAGNPKLFDRVRVRVRVHAWTDGSCLVGLAGITVRRLC
jgi:hypothetical protein